VAASISSTPSGFRTATAPIPDVPMTMPSGALRIGTTLPTGGTAGAPAVAGSAAGVVARAGTGVVVGASEPVSLLQAATSRPIASTHTSAHREFTSPTVPDRDDALLLAAASYTLIDHYADAREHLRPVTIAVLTTQW
jgi:hypothetical protein